MRTGKKAVFLCVCVAPGEQTQRVLGASVSRGSPREPRGPACTRAEGGQAVQGPAALSRLPLAPQATPASQRMEGSTFSLVSMGVSGGPREAQRLIC